MLIICKYFIAQIAEIAVILHWKKIKTGISDYPSPGEIKLKISRLFVFKPTPIFSDAEMKAISGVNENSDAIVSCSRQLMWMVCIADTREG